MRTKSMILGAALLAAGVASSMAQSNVYSLNVVGYVTLNLTNGFNLIANQLDKDGTGTNNTLLTALPGPLPDSTQVYKFSAGSFSQTDLFYNGPGWLGGGGITFNPGEGLFVLIPNNIPGNSTNVTFVGQVLQGNLTNHFNSGFNIVSSQVPLAGGVTSTLGLAGRDNDQLYVFSPASQSYPNTYLYYTGPGWLPNEPTFNVGDSFWLLAGPSGAGDWTTSFTVH